MRLKFLSCLLAISVFTAQATEVHGIKLDDSLKLGESTLVLNGAGIRTKLMFKVYVGALYLSAKTTDATFILMDTGTKRVSLHMLRKLTAEKLIHALDEGLEANNSVNELVIIEPQLKSFRQQMTNVGAVKEGDVLELDYIPSKGTQSSLNGKILGITEGENFNRALLKVWLGEHPVDDDLKKAMLGTN